MPAEIEKEIRRHRKLGNLKRRGPRCCKPLLEIAFRQNDFTRPVQQRLRLGQALAIDLAARHHRQFVDHIEILRHHVGWQPIAKTFADRLPVEIDHLLVDDDVRSQLLHLADLRHGDRGRLDRRIFDENGFDLRQLDTKAANFDLIVETAEEIQRSIVSETHVIIRSVKPVFPLRLERVCDKALRGKSLGVHVAAADAGPADEQFTAFAGRHRLQVFIEDVG